MELVYLWVEEYTSIFPDNINITAIVGENGSGKSSIGGLFISLKLFSNKELNSILILKIDNLLYICTDKEITIQKQCYTISNKTVLIKTNKK